MEELAKQVIDKLQNMTDGEIIYYKPEYIPDGFVENLIKAAN